MADDYIPKFEDTVEVPKEEYIPKFEDTVEVSDNDSLDSELELIAKKHNVDPEKLRTYAVISATKEPIKGETGFVDSFLKRGIAGVGENLGMGLPAFAYKKFQDENTEIALDEAREAIDRRKNYSDVVSSIVGGAANPFGAAGQVLGTGSKAAKAGQLALQVAEGGVQGLAESDTGKEFDSTKTGALISAAIPAGIEGVGVVNRKIIKPIGETASSLIPGLSKATPDSADAGVIEKLTNSTRDLVNTGVSKLAGVVDSKIEPDSLKRYLDLGVSGRKGLDEKGLIEDATKSLRDFSSREKELASATYEKGMSEAERVLNEAKLKQPDIRVIRDPEMPGRVDVKVFEQVNGKEKAVASASFTENSDGFLQNSVTLSVNKNKRGNNLGQKMYDAVELETGKEIVPSSQLTDSGKRFWEKRMDWKRNQDSMITQPNKSSIELQNEIFVPGHDLVSGAYSTVQSNPSFFSSITRKEIKNAMEIMNGKGPVDVTGGLELLAVRKRLTDTLNNKMFKDNANRAEKDLLMNLNVEINKILDNSDVGKVIRGADQQYKSYAELRDFLKKRVMDKKGEIVPSKVRQLLVSKSKEVDNKEYLATLESILSKKRSEYAEALSGSDRAKELSDQLVGDTDKQLLKMKEQADALSALKGSDESNALLKMLAQGYGAVQTGGATLLTAPVVNPRMYLKSLDLGIDVAQKAGKAFNGIANNQQFQRALSRGLIQANVPEGERQEMVKQANDAKTEEDQNSYLNKR